MALTPDDSGVVPLGSVLDGRYRVDGVLGKGGMGRVYKGEHTSLGRAVAIKILHADLGRNKEATARFQREAIASGRLDHPNIVGVSDSGVLEDGCPYLVMEALEGEELGVRLERDKRVPWLEACEIIRGVLSGLRHAHMRDVVHRDIKPDNIFLARKDGEMVVKILDFGIAKLIAGEGNDPATTRAGLTVGTPAYLSPEQAVGGAITPASDIYSTSVVFYEMLAGRPPFEDKDPLAIMTAHVSREPPSFAEAAPDLVLPPGLEQVIRRGLEKVSAERTGSADDYLAQLDEVLRGAGVIVASNPRTSGQVVIPAMSTPPPGALIAPPPQATPMPFATTVGAAPTISFTPMPFETKPARRASIADLSEPIPRKWLVIAGVVVLAAIVIAIVLRLSNSGGTDKPKHDAPKPKHAEEAPPKHLEEAKHDLPPKHVDEPPPAKHDEAATAVDSAAGSASAAAPTAEVAPEKTVDRDAELKAALHQLTSAATCTDRKASIGKLVELGDPRAIKPLKSARYRMRGGVLGINETNTNACLKADADAAIKALSKK